jgi:hypothetical protein
MNPAPKHLNKAALTYWESGLIMEIYYETNWECGPEDHPTTNSRSDVTLSDLCQCLSSSEEADKRENSGLLKLVHKSFEKTRFTCDIDDDWRKMQAKLETDALESRVVEKVQGDSELARIFSGLVTHWNDETGGLSSTKRRYALSIPALLVRWTPLPERTPSVEGRWTPRARISI